MTLVHLRHARSAVPHYREVIINLYRKNIPYRKQQ